MGLPLDILLIDIAGFRVDGNLTGYEEEFSDCGHGEVRPDGFGDVGRDDSLNFFHKICLIKYKKYLAASFQKGLKISFLFF